MHKVIRVQTGNKLRTSAKNFFPSVYTLFKFTGGSANDGCYCRVLGHSGTVTGTWVHLTHLIVTARRGVDINFPFSIIEM